MIAARHIHWRKTGRVVQLTLDRPETANALSLQTVAELQDALQRAEADAEVRLVTITGSGCRAFSSGVDLNEAQATMTDPRRAMEYDATFGAVYARIEASPLPVLARVQAPAIGAGCLLALACDIRVATTAAKFSFPASRVGLMLGPIEHELLQKHVSVARAKFLLFSGRSISAAEAHAWNLVDVVTQEGSLDAGVDELVAQIVAASPSAIAAAKQMSNATARRLDVHGIARAHYDAVYGSDDLQVRLDALKTSRRASADSSFDRPTQC